MKFIILHLKGTLDLALANSLAVFLKEREKEPHTFLINFEEISKIEQDTISPLFEILRTFPTHFRFALCVPTGLRDTTLALFPADTPSFSNLESGKKYFESEKSTPTKDNSYLKLTEYFRKGENFYIYCPNCKVKLRIRAIGNHACPSCQIKFYFKPDLKPEPDENKTTQYEMLSLD